MLENRQEPQISVSKLGEYLDSSPIRRRRILIDQKHPTEFRIGRYIEARDAMADYLARGKDDRILIQAANALYDKPITNEFEEQDRDLSLQALETFRETVAPLNLENLRPERVTTDFPPITISGVDIYVQPEVTLHSRDRDDNPTIGGIKIYLSKTHPLSETAANYVGALLYHFVSERLSDRGRPDNRLCYTIDVFAGAIHRAPRAFKRRLSSVKAASEELARSWARA